ncbi:MAG: Crp/Fnr family transcriptional regulator [Chitinophagales bacterium]|nr:Crp/Fnr family transcriptional regulator [Chitinophagales bacterium]
MMETSGEDFLNKMIMEFKNEIPELSYNAILKTIPYSEIIQVKKKDYLIKEGQYDRRIVFILKGIFRAFHIREEKEYTVWLRKEMDVFASYTSIILNQPSNLTFQALEDSTVLAINYDLLKSKIDEDVNIAKNMLVIFERIVLDLVESLEGQLILSSEERFIRMLENKPEIISRVPQHQLASVLGMEPESLSRLKNKIVKKRASDRQNKL